MTEHIVDILLVEDRPEDAELALMGLKKYNLINKIDWVKDGEEALEYIFAEGRYSHRDIKSKPKMILLDIQMPKVDGLEVLKRLRNDEQTKDIPVIMLTTSKEQQDIIDAYKLNVNAYILKPVDFGGFTEAMKTMGMFWILLNQRPY
ncbi:MAG: response regulator receiver protein [Cytophagaceae bacterium]|jgi:CheY-like chemotaxis protein|nr:response regulator receiver protein [Cytophagaceae bacterium]